MNKKLNLPDFGDIPRDKKVFGMDDYYAFLELVRQTGFNPKAYRELKRERVVEVPFRLKKAG